MLQGFGVLASNSESAVRASSAASGSVLRWLLIAGIVIAVVAYIIVKRKRNAEKNANSTEKEQNSKEEKTQEKSVVSTEKKDGEFSLDDISLDDLDA